MCKKTNGKYIGLQDNGIDQLTAFVPMFEKATIFSAIFIFTAFGFAGIKYRNFINAKNQVTNASFSIEQLTFNSPYQQLEQ